LAVFIGTGKIESRRNRDRLPPWQRPARFRDKEEEDAARWVPRGQRERDGAGLSVGEREEERCPHGVLGRLRVDANGPWGRKGKGAARLGQERRVGRGGRKKGERENELGLRAKV